MAAAAVVPALALAGCGPEAAPGRGRTVFNPYSAMDAEYAAERHRLTLPAGVVWPDHAPRQGPEDRYGEGYGASRAGEIWFCAWAREWLTQRDVDPGRRAAALAQLRQVVDTPMYRVGSAPETQRLTDAQVAAAAAGDPGPLTSMVANDCP